jgi:putative N-acetyltransferase (TIGR04045 family)
MTATLGLDGAPFGRATPPPVDTLAVWGERAAVSRLPPLLVRRTGGGDLDAYRRLRARTFVEEQGLFAGGDGDDVDDDPRTVVLVAVERDGTVVGGVRVSPCDTTGAWWAGSRLVVAGDRRGMATVGAALVGAACALVEDAGALRFDAVVQTERAAWFERLGWERVRATTACGVPHVAMCWPIGRVARLVAATKAPLGPLLAGLAAGGQLGGAGWVGDDAAPVPGGAGTVAACDAILPAMVERDPEWAGWCSVLVNINDLAATGARPTGLLDALGAPTATIAHRVLRGLGRAAAAYGVPVLGGHTQLGVPPSLAVTALGHAPVPVPGGGGRPGDDVVVSADLGGGWRPGYHGRQWDSTTARRPEELAAQLALVARQRPAAAKDVSMAGLAGTLGMLAEASGCGAELDVARVPTPAAATPGDWLTCFPGFAMVTADRPGRSTMAADPAPGLTHATCGRLVPGDGVALVWPDGERTAAVPGGVTGLGRAG